MFLMMTDFRVTEGYYANLADDSRVRDVMAANLADALAIHQCEQIEKLQEALRVLSEQLKGTPSIIARLHDKRQPKRTDRVQPIRNPLSWHPRHGASELAAWSLEQRLGRK